ncbi:hypothetical protein ACJ72_08431 [Emergomyces africanus]|uniref:Uncharacterized protein n=1 Tax=Emergomyces africanus TaxID=1955775 RepID=A0A1B7NKD2_9EURO|nr:hypothetical protein ACJ72_08431 [Emergomyces africanus]
MSAEQMIFNKALKQMLQLFSDEQHEKLKKTLTEFSADERSDSMTRALLSNAESVKDKIEASHYTVISLTLSRRGRRG